MALTRIRLLVAMTAPHPCGLQLGEAISMLRGCRVEDCADRYHSHDGATDVAHCLQRAFAEKDQDARKLL